MNTLNAFRFTIVLPLANDATISCVCLWTSPFAKTVVRRVRSTVTWIGKPHSSSTPLKEQSFRRARGPPRPAGAASSSASASARSMNTSLGIGASFDG
jgi:hypothetical protein